MNIDWARKLSSRKFWSLIVALVTAGLVMLNVDNASIEKIVALVGAFASVITYMFSEAYIDGEYAKQPVYEIKIDEELE